MQGTNESKVRDRLKHTMERQKPNNWEFWKKEKKKEDRRKFLGQARGRANRMGGGQPVVCGVGGCGCGCVLEIAVS